MRGYCHSCKHPSHSGFDCPQCGCVRYKDRRHINEARQRVWLGTVEFFVRNRWIKAEVRVKAMGHAGAAMKAVREGKRMVLKLRQRVAQVRITLTPVPKRKGGAA